MDRGFIEVSIEVEERKLDRNEFIKDMSRNCQA